MMKVLEFLDKYYLLFDLISLFLILSLIGYFVTRNKEKDVKFKINSNETVNVNIQMQNQMNTNMSLQELVKENKNVGNKESNNL